MNLTTAIAALHTGAWSSGTSYLAGQIATSGGSAYLCILAHTNHVPPNATYWKILADKGADGSNGSNGTNGVGVPTGGSTGQVLTKVNGTDYNTDWETPSGGGGLSYGVFRALMTQSGAGDPTFTTLVNTTGKTFNMYRVGTGQYGIYTSDTITWSATKTSIFFGPSGDHDLLINFFTGLGSDTLKFRTWSQSGAAYTDGILTSTFIEIGIYP